MVFGVSVRRYVEAECGEDADQRLARRARGLAAKAAIFQPDADPLTQLRHPVRHCVPFRMKSWRLSAETV